MDFHSAFELQELFFQFNYNSVLHVYRLFRAFVNKNVVERRITGKRPEN